MKIFARLSAAACVLAACASASPAQGQQTPQARPQQPATAVARPADSAARTDADENFELNIAERRITEQNFFASTAVAAGDGEAPGLDLRVGVAVGAERIDVMLRNVRGRVRFRGSLDALRRVLEARRAAAPAAPRDVP